MSSKKDWSYWLNVFVTEGLYDKPFVAPWTKGFDQLAHHVAEFTPEWAAPITNLSPDLIRETARVMAANLPRAAIIPGRHVTWYGNDTQCMRAIHIVNALLGAYGRESGIYFNKSPYIETYQRPSFTIAGSSGGCSAESGQESEVLPLGPSGKARADGAHDKFPCGATAMQELIDPMLTSQPYPIKALIIYGTNLLNTIPNLQRTIEAIKKLDFVLAIDATSWLKALKAALMPLQILGYIQLRSIGRPAAAQP